MEVKIMDSGKHAVIGALLGFGGYLFYKSMKREPPNIVEAILISIGGALAGLVPDILEPAYSPSHRGLFHSLIILALLAYGNLKVWQIENLTEDQKLIFSLLSGSYASHLVADGTTPKGLPALF